MVALVTCDRDGDIAVITVNNPPVNALAARVRQELVEAVDAADRDEAVRAIIITGAGRAFSAGADITEFGKPEESPRLSAALRRVEDCTKPVIAALGGTALGGGLELALGAHYRIGSPSCSVGLPEVQLGLLPGAGGTQRLLRLTGVPAALDMTTSGRVVPAAEALALGILDRISQGDVLPEALAYAREIADSADRPRRTGETAIGADGADAARAAIADARTKLERSAKGLYAPFRIVDCIEFALSNSLDDGLAYESQAFLDCVMTPQSQGLIHAFFSERASATVPEAKNGKPRNVSEIGIVGGGTMGAGISVAALDAGYRVTMVERDREGVNRGIAGVANIYDRLVTRNRMTAEAKEDALSRFHASQDYESLSGADLIIEAVFEQMDVKKQVFEKLDKVAKPGAVLASNTSFMDIDEIASVTSRPSDVLGLHFFSPANIMKLLEIVIPSAPNEDAVATAFAFAKATRKVPVRAGNADGFIGNRILEVYGLAAAYMVEDGADPYELDQVIVDFGYPLGIFAMYDLAGLDIGWANRQRLAPTRPASERYVDFMDKICEKGRFGQKTGRGVYLYPDGARKGVPDPEVLELVETERKRKGIVPRHFEAGEIRRRYFAAMINEGMKVLEEGIALKPSDIDVVAVHGYGFPRYRGGPMKYADMYGLARVLADLREFSKEDAHYWRPADLLLTLVEDGLTLESLNQMD